MINFIVLAIIVNGIFHSFITLIDLLGLWFLYEVFYLGLVLFYLPIFGYITTLHILFVLLFIYLNYLLLEEKLYSDHPIVDLLLSIFFFSGFSNLLRFIFINFGLMDYLQNFSILREYALQIPLLGRVSVLELLIYVFAFVIAGKLLSNYLHKD